MLSPSLGGGRGWGLNTGAGGMKMVWNEICQGMDLKATPRLLLRTAFL